MTDREILNHLLKCYQIYLSGDMKPVRGYSDTFYSGVLWAFARLTEIQSCDDEVEWIEMTDNYGHSSYFCSRCGTQEGIPYDICPNCSAEMGDKE